MATSVIDLETYGAELNESRAAGDYEKPYPGMISMSTRQKERLLTWLDDWYHTLDSAHQSKLEQFKREEEAYRAKSLGPQADPFVGASGDVVPLIAMAVDPIVARLDTGIFKADPVFRIKGLRKDVLGQVESLEKWVNYYQKHQLQLRKVMLPRLIELAKHGTMVFKTVYDCTEREVMSYDRKWKVERKKVKEFAGPKIYGISLADFMFPPYYQDLQLCPIVFERQRVTYQDLLIAQASGKITNVKQLKGEETYNTLNILEAERAKSANHEGAHSANHFIEVFEWWGDFSLDEDKPPVRLVGTYHPQTRTLLQLRYNYYFHQRKPYTVIPYNLTNDSLYGIGIAEMTLNFQEVLTQWQRHALNNAYLANIRMFIARTDSQIEAKPKLYSGRVFKVPDPSKDFVPFNAASDTYPSTLTERQNVIGLAEKRTGVSDYLTGRESPIVGSRATATSTLALIQEGTKRVEEVLENIRNGCAEMLNNCLYIWIQYGLGTVDDLVFANDQVAEDLKTFFDSVDNDNIHGALTIDLSATDAASNRSVQQQVQLAIIQTMMMYLQKVVELGKMAVESAQTMPVLAQMADEVLKSARKMFKDLLTKYEIPNPDEYLPDLERFLQQLGGAGAPGAGGQPGGTPLEPDLSAFGGANPAMGGGYEEPPSNGQGSGQPVPFAGGFGGL